MNPTRQDLRFVPLLLLCVFALALSPASYARDPDSPNLVPPQPPPAPKKTRVVRRKPASVKPVPAVNPGWYLLGGVDGGISYLTTSISGEEDKSGLGGNLKVIASRYWTKWVFDGALGLEYKQISGARDGGFEASLITRALLLEVGFRRRLGRRWELGAFVALNTFADLSHRPTINPILENEEAKNLIFLTGFQALYTTQVGNTVLRFGLRATTDIDIPNRQLIEVMGIVQIGFPLFAVAPVPEVVAKPVEPKPTPTPEPSPSPTPTESPLPEPIASPTPSPSPTATPTPSPSPTPTPTPTATPAPTPLPTPAPIKYFEMNARIFFRAGSDSLTPDSLQVLRKLGALLKKNPEKFTKVEIGGHSDSLGSRSFNFVLSQRRADSVSAVLEESGVPNAVLIPKGYGSSKPLARMPASDKRNRRVGMKLHVVGQQTEFLAELKRVLAGR